MVFVEIAFPNTMREFIFTIYFYGTTNTIAQYEAFKPDQAGLVVFCSITRF